MTFFDDRAKTTQAKLSSLAAVVSTHLGADETRIMRDTCIYVVGSGGRGEMSSHSDVDLFVARADRSPSEVDAFVVQHAIARALFQLKLPDPSGGGEYLGMHTAKSLCEQMGTPADDATNTFTARMLLLLESCPLVNEEAYRRLVGRVIGAYWQNAKGHEDDYQPFVLVNDVVRYWRSLLLHYVAKNTEKAKELLAENAVPERRLRSYKLRMSRALTCFSTLAAILATTSKGGVRSEDILAIVGERPIERLERARTPATGTIIDEVHALYETFLRKTDAPKKDLLTSFADRAFSDEAAREGDAFGNALFDLLLALGHEGRAKMLFRYMVV